MAGKPIKFTIVGDSKDFQQAMGKAEASMDDAKAHASSAGSKIDSAMEGAAESSDKLASRASQAAGAMSGLGDLVGGPVGAAMQAGGVATQAFADSGDLLNAVLESTTLKMIRTKVATIAQTIATKAQAVATKAMAVAQRVLNAAMKANPILLIVSLLALLGGCPRSRRS